MRAVSDREAFPSRPSDSNCPRPWLIEKEGNGAEGALDLENQASSPVSGNSAASGQRVQPISNR